MQVIDFIVSLLPQLFYSCSTPSTLGAILASSEWSVNPETAARHNDCELSARRSPRRLPGSPAVHRRALRNSPASQVRLSELSATITLS